MNTALYDCSQLRPHWLLATASISPNSPYTWGTRPHTISIRLVSTKGQASASGQLMHNQLHIDIYIGLTDKLHFYTPYN